MKNIILYHGTDHQIQAPVLDGGKATNDYGIGFYCTEHYELACEWAAKVSLRSLQWWTITLLAASIFI